MANKYMKRYSTPLNTMEMQVETMRYRLIAIRMASIQKSDNNNCWWGCRKIGTLVHCWKENKEKSMLSSVQSLSCAQLFETPWIAARQAFVGRRQWHPTPVLLLGKSHGWRSLVGCSPWGRWGSDTTERLHFHFSLPCIGEGNGNPLQCSCLENPRDRGAWWAAVCGVTQSWTWLKRLSSSSSSKYNMVFGIFKLDKI